MGMNMQDRDPVRKHCGLHNCQETDREDLHSVGLILIGVLHNGLLTTSPSLKLIIAHSL